MRGVDIPIFMAYNLRVFKSLGLALALLAVVLPAHGAESDWSRLWGWLKDQNPRAGTFVSLDGSPSAAAYLRGIGIGEKGLSSGGEAKRYADLNLGVLTSFQGGAEPLVLALVHPANLYKPLSWWIPFKSRVSIPSLPDIEMGPSFRLPTPHRSWTWRESFGLVLSLGF